MVSLQWESVVICLLASLVWAPLVYWLAPIFDRDRESDFSEKLWLAALGLAAAPTLLAPALAAAGLSLRSQPEPLPLMAGAEPIAAGVSTEPAVAPLTGPPFGETVIDAVSILYVYGLILALALAGARAIAFMLRIRRARPVEDRRLIDAVEAWRKRLKVGVRPSLRLSDEAASVCVYGFIRPVILVPSDLFARVSFDDGVLMCAHELAHIKRGDARLFALCSIANALFWFNPFMRKIAAHAALAAEQGADRMVLAAGVDRRAYAACFVEGLRFAARSKVHEPAPILSFTPFDKESRRRRFDAILSGENGNLLGAGKKVSLALAMAVAGGLVFAQAALAVDPQPREQQKTLDRMPVQGPITLSFDEKIKGDLGKGRPLHEGVDIAAPRGAAVVAPADGTVVEATGLYQGQPSWGNVVVIDHGGGMITRYAHLDRYTVKKGDRVRSGDKIGEVGSTGKTSGPHLHFETLMDGEPMDPLVATGLAMAPEASRAPQAVSAPTPLTPATPQTPLPSEPAPALAPARPNEPLKAAPAPETAPTPAAAPVLAPLPATENTKTDGKSRYSVTATKDGNTVRSLDGSIVALNGALADALPGFKINALDAEYALKLADGSTITIVRGGKKLSPEERKQLDKELANLRIELERNQQERQKALDEARRAREHAQQMAREARDRAQRIARDAREKALQQSQKDRERSQQMARDARERAQQIARDAREKALQQSQKDRERSQQMARDARERAQQIARDAREKALQQSQKDRERALEEARVAREQALAAARAGRERAKANLEHQLAIVQEQLGDAGFDSGAGDKESARALKEAKKELEKQRRELNQLHKQLEKMKRELKAAKERRR